MEIPPLPPLFPRKTVRPELARTPNTATGMGRIICGSASEVRDAAPLIAGYVPVDGRCCRWRRVRLERLIEAVLFAQSVTSRLTYSM